MRPLSDGERQILTRRTEGFSDLVREIAPGINELASYLGYIQPEHAAEQLEPFLMSVEEFLQNADLTALTEGQQIWLQTRLAYLIIEVLVHRHGGHPFLQADPEADFFLHYVVGNFDDGTPRTTLVEPFAIAYNVIHAAPARTLIENIDKLNLGMSSTTM